MYNRYIDVKTLYQRQLDMHKHIRPNYGTNNSSEDRKNSWA